MRNVYIVGPSCGGKTSLLHFLKDHLGTKANFPIRIVSRPQRPLDDDLENIFLGKDEIRAERAAGRFFVSWNRALGHNREQYYGFRNADVSDTDVNIFSANNALLLYPHTVIPEDALTAHDSFFIACVAPEEIRMQRLKIRSPEYDEEEVRVRIYKESIESHLKDIQVVIDSSSGEIEENAQKALDFIRSLK